MSVNILAIETSCDETACAVIRDGREILSDIVASQAELFKLYGGVVPEIASRKHVELIIPVINEAIMKAGVDIDAIAVTKGPGLVGALLVGIAAAKGLAFTMNKPLIGVNHLHGHIAANFISDSELKPPFICLLASGGHSHVLLVRDYTDIVTLGKTRDDAAGEAFDKIARALGLGYPGGPKVDAIGKNGNPEAITFPRSHFRDNPYDFSFSGLKTAVLNHVNIAKQKNEQVIIEDVCASFEKAVADVLVQNTIRGLKEFNLNRVVMAGGVAANSFLRNEMQKACDQNHVRLSYPPIKYCTDNAAMIGSYAYFQFLKSDFESLDLNAQPELRL
ncbi:MAG: tRNA (adenosine(37)-N6)-threonylcarbamoyltransferase complex transferase subunit TsaD [Clostridia bacterium]|nr:tRNA (adenosine(37)-N6)-threonylcarbamoyltransferase complex transferase subunit TsaD [Clostridia bacterium]